ncbi:type VI secretion system protein TssA [Defluviimonas aestuarii]|uniref:type VI secretion system protein TssA n=1 Tax=Albidovulum aestuarii TaxID=1130726 RepID=UPI002499E0CE|nr:type VI secretion system protein TssA [Defluviimonas aestuarii]MDI3337728.1 type VI secretion system protein TssA [Defluviimonas aestuarii]
MRDLEAFLAPVDNANPSGVELRNDARFHAIERLLEPASRRYRLEDLTSGGTGAVTLDWDGLIADAEELAATGRDLRLLVIVARAAANEAGFAGLAAGLTLLAETVEKNWDHLHPALRDGGTKREAATRRINALYQIENDENGVLGDLQFNIVMTPRGIGPVSGADLAAGMVNRNTVLNEAPSGLGDKERATLVAEHEVRVARVRTACRATAAERPEELQALANDVAAARDALTALETALNAQVADNGVGVGFKSLATFLYRVATTVAAAQEDDDNATEETEMTPAPAEQATVGAPQTAPTPQAAMPDQINSRRDVERALDQIIAFYERTEPSSPIPHLAKRMRKMVPMNFVELMEEIAPSGMKEFRNVAGVFDEKSK